MGQFTYVSDRISVCKQEHFKSLNFYYMASGATPVIHVSCFRCITCVKIQVYYMCSRYMCNNMFYKCKCIEYTYITHVVLHLYYMCKIYTCITCVKQVYYRCFTHVLQVYIW